MTHTQWRRFQRSKKSIAARANDKAVDPEEKLVESVRKPVKGRLSLLRVEGNFIGDDKIDSDFMDSEPDFDVVCNMVYILPAEYDVVSEVEESEEDYNPKDMEKYKSICCYVTNYGWGDP